VQWTKVKHDPTAGSEITFQAQVFSSGKVVFAYGSMTNMSAAPVSIGVVNATQSGALQPPDMPVQGDTYSFFGRATLPANIKVVPGAARARVLMPDGFLEVDATYQVFAANQFRISEVNPSTIPGVIAPWFEIESKSANPIDLQGWKIDFGAGSTLTLPNSLLLPANGRLVFGQTSGAADGVPVDYVYGSSLNLAPGSALSMTFSGSPTYASITAPPVGLRLDRSWQTGAITTGFLTTANTPTIECGSYGQYGSHLMHGTPGAANVECPGIAAPSSIPSAFEPIAATGTKICTLSADNSVDAVTPAVPFNLFSVSVPTLYVSSNGFVTPNAPTCTGTTCDANKSTPSTVAPLGTIAPFWDDLVSNGVYWQSRDPDGIPGTLDEYTIISWEGSIRKNQSADSLNFQVKLFANGNIEYHYATMTEHGSGATTWLEEPTGRVASKFNINSATTPGVASISAIRFSLR
jgi:hypothetical protein